MATAPGAVPARHVVLVLLLGIAVMAATVWLARPTPNGIAMIGPAASPDGYQVWAQRTDGTPVRWNPCQPVDWVLNPRGAPDDARTLVMQATERIAAATGLTFRYAGTTQETPANARATIDVDRYGPQWSPVLVSWTAPDTQTALRATDQGVAVPVAVDGVFVTAQVLLNVDRQLASDFTDRSESWGGVLTHEFGHVVGLDHVDDPTQLMFEYPGRGPVTFGRGDRAGLAAVGTGSGQCLDAGAPRSVEVSVAEPS